MLPIDAYERAMDSHSMEDVEKRFTREMVREGRLGPHGLEVAKYMGAYVDGDFWGDSVDDAVSRMRLLEHISQVLRIAEGKEKVVLKGPFASIVPT